MNESSKDDQQSSGDSQPVDEQHVPSLPTTAEENSSSALTILPSGEGDGGGDACQHYVVGIGASAGGLEALEKLFTGMPLDTGMSFVVVQHLSPDFKSHMDQLLGRVTKIPVNVVSDGIVVEPDNIYLIPPKMEMVISNGKLLLTERSREKVLSHPIDQFFRSLAQDVGRYSVGIILSGTGSDGSRGIVSIRENGGLAITQDPGTCGFDAMPLNAQETGHIQLVLAPEAMGEALRRYALEGNAASQIRESDLDTIQLEGLNRIFQLLRENHKIDFAHYKPGTIGRRIQRRIDMMNLNSLDEYVERLSNDPQEVNELYKDFLIGVTRFFRDAEAFELVEKQIVPDLIERKGHDGIRIWVCGCATGEEAYSLAILFTEAIERSGKNIEFKMFATDAHQGSLQFAATGVYPETALKDVSQERREKFFNKRRDGYYVNSDLRRLIVFAPHNVINDPPFTQMDMVTCRNLLIYFQTPAQRKTLSLFHFALKINGILFLGPSESPGEIGDEFDSINEHWKIYRKRRDVRLPLDMRLPLPATTPTTNVSGSLIDSPARGNHEALPAVYDVLLGDYMPPSVLVDERFEIVHVFPGSELFLRVPTGRPSSSLPDLVYREAKSSLAGALQHARKDNKAVRYSGLPHPSGDASSQLQLNVRPVRVSGSGADFLLVQFNETEAPAGLKEDEADYSEVNISEASNDRIEGLEQELDYTRQNLQATIEELETSNEELQATNEEMVASNEELQSTNEELHSVNEELYTVNAEHQRRLAELDEAHADMNNLLASTQVGVLFLDHEFYIRRFTPAIGRMFYMQSQDIGRSVESFLSRIDDEQFLEKLKATYEKRTESEWEVKIEKTPYFVRALPYWNDRNISGVVVAFINIEALKRTESDLQRFKFMSDEGADAQVLIDSDGRVTYTNEAMAKKTGYSTEELIGMSVTQFDAEVDRTEFQRIFAKVSSEKSMTFESTHRRKDGEKLPVEISLTHVVLEGMAFVYANIRDISERRQAETEMRLLEKSISAVSNGIVITDPNQKDNPITFANPGFFAMTGYGADEVIGRNCRFLQGEETSSDAVDVIRHAIRDGEPTRVLLTNYRKDGTAFWNDLHLTPVKDDEGTVTNFVGIQNDVTDRIKVGESAKASEETIRLLLDSTAEGIYGIDRNGLCTFCNASAARMLGYKDSEELVSRSMHKMIHHHKSDGSEYALEECPIYECLQTGENTNQLGDVFFRKDDSSFPVEYWSHAIAQDGETIGAVVTFVNITERLRIEQELHEARDNAELANQAKSRFLANMSHELRTPMAAMLGFTEILQQECEDEPVLDRLEAIHRNGDYLLKLLNDVLDLSRIESGKVKVASDICQLEDLLSEVNQLMQIRTREYGNTLQLIYPAALPATISTDGSRLRQVLINLLANALKFAPGGKVDLTVQLIDGDDSPKLQFEVRDNGIGISAEDQKTMFEPFEQGDPTITQQFGGSGLGLSISRRLVEALDGDVKVESAKGKGSTFTVTIPVAPIGKLKSFPAHEPSSSGDTMIPKRAPVASEQQVDDLNAKVLIADDMRDVRYIAQHFLSKAGCDVHIAENGRQAVDMIVEADNKKEPFELVLMDMQMPILDGEGAVKELREQQNEVPVIALTAHAMKGTRRRLLAVGFDEYLSKPIDSQLLLSVAASLLERTERD